MAIGWLTLLKAVPWVDVAKKAPEIAESAKKLWSTISKKPSNSEIEIQSEPSSFTKDDQEIKWLKQQLTAIEVANTDLHTQMLASAELIKALADQNTQLINAVELNRKRIVRLTVLTIIVGIIAVYSLFSSFSH